MPMRSKLSEWQTTPELTDVNKHLHSIERSNSTITVPESANHAVKPCAKAIEDFLFEKRVKEVRYSFNFSIFVAVCKSCIKKAHINYRHYMSTARNLRQLLKDVGGIPFK